MQQRGSNAEGRERIHKVLAHAGLGSRRACEEFIALGRVTVAGRRAMIGQLVGQDDEIRVDGRTVERRQERLAYYLLNKPAGVVSSAKDELARRTVVDLVRARERVYPVGRLDADSEGLVLLTNDGELAFRLTHPRFGVKKVYQVWVSGPAGDAELARLREGVELEEGPARAMQVDLLEAGDQLSILRVVLAEGHKRQIRHMCEAVGHPVVRLQRVSLGTLRLGNLEPGRYRALTPEEVKALRRHVGLKATS